jgi:hybrid cluster-associated redox disulfide protein
MDSKYWKGENEMKIEKEMTIGQVMKAKPAAAGVLLNYGMHCLGCPASLAETLEEASVVHDIDIGELIEELNKVD